MSNSGKKVAVVLANNYEDIEYTSPVESLQKAGADIVVIGVSHDAINGKKGHTQIPDLTFEETDASQYDLLLIPGGGSPENLRINDEAVAFTRTFVKSGKPVASICHGPQLLISAEVLRDRRVTSVNKIRDDIRNAGGIYVDEPLVIDRNLITSRIPADLELFNAAIVDALG